MLELESQNESARWDMVIPLSNGDLEVLWGLENHAVKLGCKNRKVSSSDSLTRGSTQNSIVKMPKLQMSEFEVPEVDMLELEMLELEVLVFRILGLEMLELDMLRLGVLKLEFGWAYCKDDRKLSADAQPPGKDLCSNVYPERNPVCYEVRSQENLRSGMHFWKESYPGLNRRSV